MFTWYKSRYTVNLLFLSLMREGSDWENNVKMAPCQGNHGNETTGLSNVNIEQNKAHSRCLRVILTQSKERHTAGVL